MQIDLRAEADAADRLDEQVGIIIVARTDLVLAALVIHIYQLRPIVRAAQEMVLTNEKRRKAYSSDVDEAAQTHKVFFVVGVVLGALECFRVYAYIEDVHAILLDSGVIVAMSDTIHRRNVYANVVGGWIRY